MGALCMIRIDLRKHRTVSSGFMFPLSYAPLAFTFQLPTGIKSTLSPPKFNASSHQLLLD